MKLKEKVALVVGSTSGIGKSIAEKIASEGALVIITGRREEQGKTIVSEIEEKGGKADFMKLDVTNIQECRDIIDSIVSKHGKLDVLAYNAGIAIPCDIDTGDEKTWDAIMTTNLKSAFFMTQKALPELEKVNGSIIYTASMIGTTPDCGNNIAYGASKAGIIHMAKLIALSTAARGVRVNCVSPGVTKTDILNNASEETLARLSGSIPMSRLGDPEDIANAVLFLASDDAKYITGQTISICGGRSIC